MKILTPLILLTALCGFSASDAAAERAGARPHIVFVLSADMGWNPPGFHGGDPALTPNIDRLAGEAMRLNVVQVSGTALQSRTAFLRHERRPATNAMLEGVRGRFRNTEEQTNLTRYLPAKNRSQHWPA
jgi:hypothetical protein